MTTEKKDKAIIETDDGVEGFQLEEVKKEKVNDGDQRLALEELQAAYEGRYD